MQKRDFGIWRNRQPHGANPTAFLSGEDLGIPVGMWGSPRRALLIRTCLTTPATQIFTTPLVRGFRVGSARSPEPGITLRFKLFEPKHSLLSMSLGPSPILLPDLASYSAVTKFATKQLPHTSEMGKFSISPNMEYWAPIT